MENVERVGHPITLSGKLHQGNFVKEGSLIKSIDMKFEMWLFNKQWFKQDKKSKIQLVSCNNVYVHSTMN